MATAKKLTPFEEVNLFFDQAAERLGLAEGRREMLRRPWRELQVQVPVRMDDGHINVYNGFRIQQISCTCWPLTGTYRPPTWAPTLRPWPG